MSRTVAKPSWVLFPIFAVIGLIVLIFRSLAKSPQAVIRKVLFQVGLSPQMVKYWTAVSAYETAYPYDGSARPWNSPVLKDTKNLFNLIVPGSRRLQRGEGQTIYDSLEDSVWGLYQRVMIPFKYPAHVDSLEALVDAMKARGYFTQDLATYKANVRKWYNKLYPE